MESNGYMVFKYNAFAPVRAFLTRSLKLRGMIGAPSWEEILSG